MMNATYADIRNGDRVWVDGYRFTVSNVRTEPGQFGGQVVRFEGRADAGADIAGTGYDGGTYGGLDGRPVVIERDACEQAGA